MYLIIAHLYEVNDLSNAIENVKGNLKHNRKQFSITLSSTRIKIVTFLKQK